MSRCKSCGAPIRWVRTINGYPMPLDRDPSSSGRYYTLDGAAYVCPEGQLACHGDLFQSHFATCPNAGEHRQKPAPAPDPVAQLAEGRRVLEELRRHGLHVRLEDGTPFVGPPKLLSLALHRLVGEHRAALLLALQDEWARDRAIADGWDVEDGELVRLGGEPPYLYAVLAPGWQERR
jgi:hypothetical protein